MEISARPFWQALGSVQPGCKTRQIGPSPQACWKTIGHEIPKHSLVLSTSIHASRMSGHTRIMVCCWFDVTPLDLCHAAIDVTSKKTMVHQIALILRIYWVAIQFNNVQYISFLLEQFFSRIFPEELLQGKGWCAYRNPLEMSQQESVKRGFLSWLESRNQPVPTIIVLGTHSETSSCGIKQKMFWFGAGNRGPMGLLLNTAGVSKTLQPSWRNFQHFFKDLLVSYNL